MKGSRFLLAGALTAALTGSALAVGPPRRSDDGGRARATTSWQQGDQDRARRDGDDHNQAVWNRGDRDDRGSVHQGDRDDRNRGTWNQGDRDDHNQAVWNQGDRDDRGHDGDRDDRNGGYYGYPNNGPYRGVYSGPVYSGPAYPVYGNGGYGYANPEQIGFNDGVRDGQNDRATGHSFRPTQDGNYRRANDGYVGGMDKGSFQQAYRDGYMRGYQQGYQSGW